MYKEVENIMIYYKNEAKFRKPEDFLIITPFTKKNPLVDLLNITIQKYWIDRYIKEFKRI